MKYYLTRADPDLQLKRGANYIMGVWGGFLNRVQWHRLWSEVRVTGDEDDFEIFRLQVERVTNVSNVCDSI